MQMLTAVAATAVENVPATHLVHAETAEEEYVPAEQLKHTVMPVVLEYLPASHCKQVVTAVAAL